MNHEHLTTWKDIIDKWMVYGWIRY